MNNKFLLRFFFAITVILLGRNDAQASASMASDFNLDSWNGTAILTRADYGDYSYNGVFTVPTIYKDTWAKQYRVVGVAKSAFHYAPALKEIRFEEGCATVEDVAVSDCSGLVKVTFPLSLRKLGSQVFFDCPELCEVVVPPYVENCGENIVWGVVEHMAISKCAYPSHLSDPFANLSSKENLAKVTYDAGDVYMDGDIIYNADKTKIIYVGYHQHDFDIPSSVTEIGDYAFANCPYIINIELPESVKAIGKGAFKNCSNLACISLPGHMTVIDDMAFENCTGLTLKSQNLPEGLTKIGDRAFYGCAKIGDVSFPEGLLSIGAHAFDYTYQHNLNLPSTVTNLGEAAFANCLFPSVVIPSGVKEISQDLFNTCTNLESVVIPESVREIGNGAFYNCSSLASVAIPQHLRHLGEEAFIGCTSLNEVTYLSLDPQAFNPHAFDIAKTQPVTLYVQDDALSKVKTLEPWSQFPNITGVETGEFRVMVNGGIYLNFLITDPVAHTCVLRPGTDCHPGAVTPDDDTSVVYVPLTVWYRGDEYTVTGAGRRAFYNVAYSGITLHKGTKHIDEEAFFGCENLSRLVIPEKIEKIGNRAFADCNVLSTIEYWTENPISAPEDIFDDYTYENADLKTYSAAIPSFAAVSPWNKFNCINHGVTVISDLQSDLGEISAIYNLNGTRLNIPREQLSPGFYIISTSDGTKTKIFIK